MFLSAPTHPDIYHRNLRPRREFGTISLGSKAQSGIDNGGASKDRAHSLTFIKNRYPATAVNKAGWMFVDGSRIRQPRTSWPLSANCRVAVRPQMYRRESRVLYANIRFFLLVPNINARP